MVEIIFSYADTSIFILVSAIFPSGEKTRRFATGVDSNVPAFSTVASAFFTHRVLTICQNAGPVLDHPACIRAAGRKLSDGSRLFMGSCLKGRPSQQWWRYFHWYWQPQESCRRMIDMVFQDQFRCRVCCLWFRRSLPWQCAPCCGISIWQRTVLSQVDRTHTSSECYLSRNILSIISYNEQGWSSPIVA